MIDKIKYPESGEAVEGGETAISNLLDKIELSLGKIKSQEKILEIKENISNTFSKNLDNDKLYGALKAILTSVALTTTVVSADNISEESHSNSSVSARSVEAIGPITDPKRLKELASRDEIMNTMVEFQNMKELLRAINNDKYEKINHLYIKYLSGNDIKKFSKMSDKIGEKTLQLDEIEKIKKEVEEKFKKHIEKMRTTMDTDGKTTLLQKVGYKAEQKKESIIDSQDPKTFKKEPVEENFKKEFGDGIIAVARNNDGKVTKIVTKDGKEIRLSYTNGE